jgi:GDP-L-fucose synthase
MLRLSDKKILVTGGKGFLGTAVVNALLKHNVPKKQIIITDSKKDDLRSLKNCQRVTKGIDVVIHLAARVGGIGYNQENPGTLFYDNLTIGVHLMEEARLAKVKKFVAIGTVCAYPKYTAVPFKEEDLWNGYPEETNAPYGLAKKMLLVQAQAYRQQYGFNAIYLLPVNLYGPGDNFDPRSSHVIPALIRKFVEAKEQKQPTVTIWGTGKATREFLYVGDAAEAIILATQKYDKADPINIGASFEISIKKLALLIKEIVRYKGKVIWDTSKPDGQPRRCLNTTKAKKEFGFKAKTNFKKGLKETIAWYKKNYREK